MCRRDRYPCEAGAVLGGASAAERETLVRVSRNLGIAFQITDDILDVEGDEKLVGKTLKKDKAQNKLNFVSKMCLRDRPDYAV